MLFGLAVLDFLKLRSESEVLDQLLAGRTHHDVTFDEQAIQLAMLPPFPPPPNKRQPTMVVSHKKVVAGLRGLLPDCCFYYYYYLGELAS